MSIPKVSVIVPTHNRAWCILKAVTSVLEQSFEDFELIVVDDGSTDETGALIKKIKTRDTRLSYYFYPQNKGPSAARNMGIKMARGEYITFLDSDDLWEKDKLREQVICAKKYNSRLVFYTDEIWIRNGVRVNPMKKHGKYSGWIFSKCLPLCTISPSSIFMHFSVFSAVGCFDEEFTVCEDYDLWLRLSNLFYIHFIPKKLIVKYGGHKDQLSNRYWGNDMFRVKALIKAIEAPLTLDYNRKQAIAELKNKSEVLYSGFKKREKYREAELFRRIYNSYC